MNTSTHVHYNVRKHSCDTTRHD